jgi:integrase
LSDRPRLAAAKRAGVEGYIPYDSRRSAIRNMRNEGIPQSVRKKIMGHSTDSMDQRYGIIDLADVEFVRNKMNSTTASKTASLDAPVEEVN